MSEESRHPEPNVPSPGGEELDALLRQWHRQNAERAAAGREALMARLRAEESAPAGAVPKLELPPLIDEELEASLRARQTTGRRPGVVFVLRRISMNRIWIAAAAAIILAATLPLMLINRGPIPGTNVAVAPTPNMRIQPASFEGYIMCPEGGRLDARDADGEILGPCELKHTDVKVDVSGFLTRVTVTQKYHNPHSEKIEAGYTFPMSERSAVDRMTMTVGNRVIEGQVKEKAEARRIYEEAKANNRIASLLEQERPNIFTQSIANLEPGADIDITISYVETTKQIGGVFEFDFPTTITPRFIPGNPVSGDTPPALPRPNITRRYGLVLLAPATISELRAGDSMTHGTLSEADMAMMLRRAVPIRAVAPQANIWYTFRAAYQDGSAEFGTLYTDGVGTINGRWFCVPEHAMPGNKEPAEWRGGTPQPGAPFSPDTDRVPDASKITPMPVTPGTRAGHDISISVNIDTGGPALGMVTSELHDVVASKAGSRATVTLKNNSDIPNRDFVLKWRQESREVEPAVFTYTGDRGNFFAVQMTPPPATSDDEVAALAVPREMIFVLDVSGSMKGRPIEKAKEVLDKALTTLRPGDTFNVIKFQNTLETLWSGARPATPENLVEARAFYNQQIGGGGTQMLPAIQAAYRAGAADAMPMRGGISSLQLANQPADGRRIVVDAEWESLGVLNDGSSSPRQAHLRVSNEITIDLRLASPLPQVRVDPRGIVCRLTGTWQTLDGKRVFIVESSSIEPRPGHFGADPYRLIVFITDGIIGNDNEVIAEIQSRQGRAAIFPFAIGSAPNRYLLDSMARFGRGEVEYVYDNTNADEVIARFAKRIQTPVLTNIKVEFSPNLNVLDVMTALGGGGGAVASIDAIPDLFDVKPLTIVGRYNQPASGTVTISGMTAAGPYRRVVNIDLPAPLAPEQLKALEDVRLGIAKADEAIPGAVRDGMRRDTIATLWARAKVEAVTAQDLRGVLSGNVNPGVRSQIITLGETFNLVTQYTSFVAVDRLRITVAGKPRLVHIPIELTAGTDFTGFFGGPGAPALDRDDEAALLGVGQELTHYKLVPQSGVDTSAAWKLAVAPAEQDDAFTTGFQTRRTRVSLDTDGKPGEPNAPGEAKAPAILRKTEEAAKQPPEPVQAEKQRSYRVERPGATPARDPSPPPPAKPATPGYDQKNKSDSPVKKSSSGPGDSAGGREAGAGGGKPAERAAPRAEAPRDAKKEAEPAPSSAPTNAPAGVAPEKEQSPPPATKPEPARTEVEGLVTQTELNRNRSIDAKLRELTIQQAQVEQERARVGYVAPPGGAPNVDALVELHTDYANSTFFGMVKQDMSATAPIRLQLEGIDPARAPDAAKVLGLYFTIEPSPVAGAPQADKAVDAPIAPAAKTSHEGNDAAKSAETPRQHVVLAEHVIIRIGKLVHENKLEQAASLANALAEALPDVAAVAEVKRVLSDAAVTPDERTRIIDEQTAAARQRLDAILRDAKVRQRLAPELLPYVNVAGLPASLGTTYDGPIPCPPGATMIDGGILISILVDDVNDAARAAVTAAGLRIESADAQTRVIVGVAPLGKLADIALVDGVRKVEATRE